MPVVDEVKIEARTFRFAKRIFLLHTHFLRKREDVLSRQLLRCGTSIGANVAEAQAAQSRKDFIAKMSIAPKEARETVYWLRLLDETQLLDDYPDRLQLKEEAEIIVRILTKIVKTTNQLTTNNHQPKT